MKKIILILICLFGFKYNVFALDNDKFHKDYVIGDYGYIYNKNGSNYYSQFYKAILKDDTKELVYCIEPGTRLSTDSYERLYSYSDKINFSREKMDLVKLIAYYGYLYADHTDIKWYEATQYLIWQTVKPDNWVIYFVDRDQNKVELYPEEVDEILNLVNNHHSKPNIDETYVVNYLDDFVIEDDYQLLNNYKTDIGIIKNNRLFINDDLKPGDYVYNLNTTFNDEPVFYVNDDSQNIFQRGNILDDNISFKVHVTAGRININECNIEHYKDEFIGGTYEILNIDDEVVDEVTCTINDSCLSELLPVGSYKVRVKKLSDEYEYNDHIYDVQVVDGDNSNVTLCSFKKNRNIISTSNINSSDSHNTVTVNNNFLYKIYDYFSNQIQNTEKNLNESSNLICEKDGIITKSAIIKNDDLANIDNNDNKIDFGREEKEKSLGKAVIASDEKEIDIPNTSKSNYIIPTLFLIIIFLHLFFLNHEKNN